MIEKTKLIDVSMRKDKKCGKYLFTLTYHCTHKNGRIDEYIFKDVENPFSENNFTIDRGDTVWLGDRAPLYLDLDEMQLLVTSGEIICKTIKEPDPIEVTMEEIEKKYGCPIKIVKSKEDK